MKGAENFNFTHIVEPRPVDTPLLWTPRHCGHFSPGPFGFPYMIQFIKYHFLSAHTLVIVRSHEYKVHGPYCSNFPCTKWAPFLVFGGLKQ